MNTSEILTRAADLIEERGWNQGWYVNDCGGLCVRGAMYAAVGVTIPTESTTPWEYYDSDLGRDVHTATLFLDRCIGRPVERWNDTTGRTKEEVTAALRGAAEAARAEQ